MRFIVGLLLSVGSVLCAQAADASATATMPKVLFFTKSSGFEHSVIKRRADGKSFADRILQDLAARHRVEVTCSKDGALFSTDYLAQFDAFVFFTSGDLLTPGVDGNPPLTTAGKQALLEAVKAGKGFVGIHQAAGTFTGDEPEPVPGKPRMWVQPPPGAETEPFLQMLGGRLLGHGTQQIARQLVADPKFPGMAGCGESFSCLEEWYSLANFAPDLHVILVHDTATMRDPHANGKDWPPTGWDTPYQRPPFPATWAHLYGQGRVFYTSMGHREDVWESERFQSMLMGGLAWTLRRVDADVSPNLAKVTPEAEQRPPSSRRVGGLPRAVREQEAAKYYPGE